MNKALASTIIESSSLSQGHPIHASLKGIPDEVRAGIKISAESTYISDAWDLSQEHPNLHPANVTLHLSRIYFNDGTTLTSQCKAHYRRSVLEYLYSMLINPPSSRPKWSTVCSTYHKGVARLLRYMDDHAFRQFSDLGATDLEQFLELLASESVKGQAAITDRALRARVSGLSWLFEQSSKLEDGLHHNPFGHYGSAGRWANACCQKLIPRGSQRTIEMPDEVASAVFTCALADLSIGDTLHRLNEERQRYVPRYYGANKILLNPFPWHEYGMGSGTEIVRWEARLATACYIVIAMLTGMRWHEVVSIRTGASKNWQEEEIVNEGVQKKFYFVISSTNKLQAEPVRYMWQTLPLVKSALDAAEIGLARRRRSGTFLFPAYAAVGSRTSDSTSAANFKRFVSVHDIKYKDKLWNLASHQFRKKFSRIMTRQGLGIKALQDQLKHFNVEMTRAYSDINLYVELQREKFDMSKEHYDEIMRGQKRYIGGGAKEIAQLQRKFLGMTKSQQSAFLSELPKSALVEQLDDGLCMYRSKHALCGGEVAACRPADCNNALISIQGKRKSFLWRKHENMRLLEFFRNDSPKIAYLRARNIELDKLISQIDEVEQF